ncbi:MAG TPA: type VI secretion system protein TssA [Gammaproteobacteria bacterium]
MPAIDVEKYLRPISAEAPCGDNLEYDAAFAELGRLATATVERLVAGKVTPAIEPPWGDVFQQADELLGRTRDVRTIITLINAGLKTEGLPALAAGLKLINGLSRTYWKEIHPQLDPDDGDATLRLNSLLELEARPLPGAEKQPPSLLKNLDDAPLVKARVAGTFTRRDLKLANREITPPTPVEPPSLDLIEAAFREADVADLQATAAAARESLFNLKDLSTYLRETVGAQRAPEFGTLRKELESIDRVLTEKLTARGVAPAGAAGAPAPAAGGEAAPAAARVDGEIRNRDDVVRTLDRLCDYFRKHEPSSPVPLLLQRAKSLVAKDFLAILRELTPDGVAQAEVIVGAEKKEE